MHGLCWPDNGKPHGFAFISMDPENAELAITNIDGTKWNHWVIDVCKAMAQKKRWKKWLITVKSMGQP